MYTVYVIYNRERNKIYIGQTENLDRRLLEHNDIDNKKHRYTKKLSGLWSLIHSEKVSSRADTLKREKQLKSYRGRQFIKSKIDIPA